MADMTGLIKIEVDLKGESPTGAPVNNSELIATLNRLDSTLKKESTADQTKKHIADKRVEAKVIEGEKKVEFGRVQDKAARSRDQRRQQRESTEYYRGEKTKSTNHQRTLERITETAKAKLDVSRGRAEIKSEFAAKRAAQQQGKMIATGVAGAVMLATNTAMQAVVAKAAYTGGAPYLNMQNQAKAALANQNQIRSLYASAGSDIGAASLAGAGALIGSAILPGIGTIIGATVGGVAGLAGGGLIKAHVAQTNAARSGALNLAIESHAAYLSGALPRSDTLTATKMTGTAGLAMTVPTSLDYFRKHHDIQDYRAYVMASGATRKLGYNISKSDPAIQQVNALLAAGIDPSKILPGAAFLSAQSGKSLTQVLGENYQFSRRTGLPQTAIASVARLSSITDLGGATNAQNFLGATTPMGSQYQQMALQYHASLPVSQYVRRMKLKAFFPTVNAKNFFGGGTLKQTQAADEDFRRYGLEHYPNELTRSIVESQITDGAANYYAATNAPTGSSVSGETKADRSHGGEFEKMVDTLGAVLTAAIKQETHYQSLKIDTAIISHATIEESAEAMNPGV